MTRAAVEQVKFSDGIGTEPRFAFRKWLEVWAESVNAGNRDIWQPAVLESVTVQDLVDKELDYDRLVSYLTNPPKKIFIPKSSVGVEDGLYVVRGSLEVYSESLMVFEGMFEMVVHDIGTFDFKIFGITCYPHFRVSV